MEGARGSARILNDIESGRAMRDVLRWEWLARVTLFPLALAASLRALSLERIVRSEPGLPLWDEAAQSLVGAQLLDALRAGRVLEFLRLLNDQVVWPFLHGAMLLPWMAFRGDDWESAARANAWLAALLPLLAFAAGTRLHPARGLWAGAIAAALLLTAPLHGVFGTLGMLEVPGAFLLALTFTFHAFARRTGASRTWWIAAGLSTTALVLLKYNYGLLWTLGLLLFEWLERPPRARRAALASLRARLATGSRHPMAIVLGFYALGLIAILMTGGGVFTLFGHRISMRSPGNPAYGWLLLACGWAAVSFARRPAVWRERWRALPERARILFATTGAPLLVWFLIPVPNRVRALVEFSINRASGPEPWTLEGLFYYPGAFVRDYAAVPWLGWCVLALALIPPRRLEPPAARLAWCAALVGLIATAAHRYHDPRFLFTTVVPIALSASARLVALVAMVTARTPRPAADLLWALALIAALAAPFTLAPAEARLRAGHRAFRGPAGLEAPIDLVLSRAALAPEPGVLLGVSNSLSPALLEWRARERGAPPRDRLPRRARPGEFTVSPAGMRAIVIPPRVPVFAVMPAAGSPLDSVTRGELSHDRRALEDLMARADLERTVDSTFASPAVRVVELRSRLPR